MSIEAIKELRARTGAGMMECKKALAQVNQDIEQAIEFMRKSGALKAHKKADRVAAEGLVVLAVDESQKRAAMLEINCETDFVARDEHFVQYAQHVVDLALQHQSNSMDALTALSMSSGDTVEQGREQLIAKIGENVRLRRFELFAWQQGVFAHYVHGSRIGVMVQLSGGHQALAHDLALHIAASKPQYIHSQQVPQSILDKEQEIFQAQMEDSNKPAEVVEKIMAGKLNKFINEITLVGQPFVKEPDKTVGQLLKENDADVTSFARFEVGEGIDKPVSNLAEEVAAQTKAMSNQPS